MEKSYVTFLETGLQTFHILRTKQSEVGRAAGPAECRGPGEGDRGRRHAGPDVRPQSTLGSTAVRRRSNDCRAENTGHLMGLHEATLI